MPDITAFTAAYCRECSCAWTGRERGGRYDHAAGGEMWWQRGYQDYDIR